MVKRVLLAGIAVAATAQHQAASSQQLRGSSSADAAAGDAKSSEWQALEQKYASASVPSVKQAEAGKVGDWHKYTQGYAAVAQQGPKSKPMDWGTYVKTYAPAGQAQEYVSNRPRSPVGRFAGGRTGAPAAAVMLSEKADDDRRERHSEERREENRDEASRGDRHEKEAEKEHREHQEDRHDEKVEKRDEHESEDEHKDEPKEEPKEEPKDEPKEAPKDEDKDDEKKDEDKDDEKKDEDKDDEKKDEDKEPEETQPKKKPEEEKPEKESWEDWFKHLFDGHAVGLVGEPSADPQDPLNLAKGAEADAYHSAYAAFQDLHKLDFQSLLQQVAPTKLSDTPLVKSAEAKRQHAADRLTQAVTKLANFTAQKTDTAADFDASEAVELVDRVHSRLRALNEASAAEEQTMKRQVKEDKAQALDLVRSRWHAARDAAKKWRAAGKANVKAMKKARVAEHVFEHVQDQLEDATEHLEQHSESVGERLEDQVQDFFDDVSDAVEERTQKLSRDTRATGKEARQAVYKLEHLVEDLGAEDAYARAKSERDLASQVGTAREQLRQGETQEQPEEKKTEEKEPKEEEPKEEEPKEKESKEQQPEESKETKDEGEEKDSSKEEAPEPKSHGHAKSEDETAKSKDEGVSEKKAEDTTEHKDSDKAEPAELLSLAEEAPLKGPSTTTLSLFAVSGLAFIGTALRLQWRDSRRFEAPPLLG